MDDDPREAPTTPDLRRYDEHHWKCPACKGSGVEWPGESSPCSLCGGRRAIDRHELAVWHARTQGRSP